MNEPLHESLIRDWGLEGMPHEAQVDIIDRLGAMLYQAVLVRSLDILSETDQIELDLLFDEDTTTPSDVIAFLQKKIPTFVAVVTEERNKIKQEILML